MLLLVGQGETESVAVPVPLCAQGGGTGCMCRGLDRSHLWAGNHRAVGPFQDIGCILHTHANVGKSKGVESSGESQVTSLQELCMQKRLT